jgi:RNA polymerase sigma factor (sigma-70 family)
MASLASASVVRQIGSLFEGSSVAGLSDRQLLDRFISERDSAGEAAFAALVVRHGSLVLAVCVDVLTDRHDAEDAFQAVFLILAQKARSIREPELLANWLYGVALRTARHAKLRRRHRRRTEKASSIMNATSNAAASSAEQSLLAHERAEVLHEEIERLPRAFRLPVVLCYLEGLTVHEAARRLRCPHGTIRSRMARARERLRRALNRRGVVLPAAAMAAAISARSASASVSAHLCETTTRAAIAFAAGQSAAPLATAVTKQLLRSTLVQKVRLLALSLFVLGAIATCAGYLTHALARNDEATLPVVGIRSGQASRQQAASPNPDANRIVITGRVVAPDGKPVAGARVAVVSKPQPRPEAHLLRESEHSEVLGSATAQANGRFRVDLPQVAAQRDGFTLFVGAKGWALTGKILGDDLSTPDLTITMEPERIVRGRILDLQGQPISGVRVHVSRYHALPFKSPDEALAWPRPATTDQAGRFTIPDLDPNTTIQLEASSDRHAPQSFKIEPRDAAKTTEPVLTLAPAQVVEVRTTSADDGKPIAGVWVNVLAARNLSQPATGARTDDQGIARILPATGESFVITADPPVSEPYLDQQTFLDWPKGAVRQTMEVKLSRGIRVHGTITEETSRAAIAGALVRYFQTIRNNPVFRRGQGQRREAVTGPDGKFEIIVPAGPGHLLVRAASPDYLHVFTKSHDLGTNPAAVVNLPMYPDAVAHIDLKADAAPDDVKLRLRRGVTVAGRVIGPDAAPVASAIVLGRSYRPYTTISGPRTSMNNGATWHSFMAFGGRVPKIKVRDGRFEIPGCDPDRPFIFHFFDREHQLGATVELFGKSDQNGPVTVQLEKCGTATVRYKDAQGKPVAGYAGDALLLVMSPGTDLPGADPAVADMDLYTNLDPERSRELRSDADGRVAYVSLIPGATYRLRNHDFTAEAGKTIELPDLTPRPRQ